jgi:hypothetical protein
MFGRGNENGLPPPCGANGAEMLRLACCLATERGIEVCAPVHDAILCPAGKRRLPGADPPLGVGAAQAEAIREYGLTPDDVHDSYNLWMRTTVTPDGRREFHWNRARKNDYVDLLAVIDTLSVPIICGIDTIPLNNYGPGSIRLQVFAASPSTGELVEIFLSSSPICPATPLNPLQKRCSSPLRCSL